MTQAPIPLLIFDFDGTLANTIDTGVAVFNEVGPEFGLRPLTIDEVGKLRKLNIRAVLDHIGINKLTAIKLATRIRKELHERMDEVGIVPGIAEAVAGLHEKGFRLGILSSNSTDNIRGFMKRFDMAHCFEFIEAGVSLFGKSRRILSTVKKYQTPLREVMYVGDETRDMEAARRARVRSLAVCWGANEKEAMMTEDPDFCVEKPYELVSCAEDFRKSIQSRP